jgi:preprotein translocase subunit SecA
MDYLREGIHLRGFAQIDPLVAYKNEGFDMFTGLINSIWEEFARYIFNVDVEVEDQDGNTAPAGTWSPTAGSSSTGAGSFNYLGGTAADQPSALAEAAAAGPTNGQYVEDYDGEPAELLPVVEQRTVDEREQIGRNDPCWCGSGKKYKKCHGA